MHPPHQGQAKSISWLLRLLALTHTLSTLGTEKKKTESKVQEMWIVKVKEGVERGGERIKDMERQESSWPDMERENLGVKASVTEPLTRQALGDKEKKRL